MAAFNFPNSPSTNDIHTENGISWKWNGTVWKKVASPDTIAKADSKVQVVDAGTGGYITAETDGTQRLRVQNSGAIVTGILTATSFVGALTGNVTGNATGLSGTPNITVGALTASTGQFSGNVNVLGTLTYEDVKNVDSAGIATARQGLRITGGGLNVVGVSTLTGTLNVDAGSAGMIDFGDITSAYGRLYADSTGTFIGSKSNHALILRTNNTERLRIDTSGRLLLGTTTEGQGDADNLTIRDSGNCGITIRSSDVGWGVINFSDATSGAGEYDGFINYSQQNRFLKFGTASTERLRIDSSGRVIIGTTSQTQGQLGILNTNDFSTASVSTNTDNLWLISDATSGDGVYGASIGFSRVQYADRRAAAIASVQEGSDEDFVGLAFFTHDNADATAAIVEKLRIKSAGGFTFQQGNTNYPTDFIGGASNGRNYVRIKAGNTTSGHSSGFKLNHSDGNGVISVYINHNEDHGHFMNEHQGGDILFYTNQSGSSLEKLRITSSGQIKKAQGANVTSLKTYNSNADAFWLDHYQYQVSSTYQRYTDIVSIGDSTWGSNIRFFTNANGSANGIERLRITSSGQLAINKTSTISAKLHIGDTGNDGALSQLIKLGNDSSGAGTGSQINLGAGNGVESTSACIGGFLDGTGTSFIVKTAGTYANQGTVAERLRIRSDGIIQIGNTENPTNYNVKDIMLGNHSGNHGITILSGTSNGGYIMFSDNNGGGSNAYRGQIEYQHNGDYMRFITGTLERLRIDSNGHLILQGGKIYGEDNASNVLTLQSTSGNNNHSRVEIGATQSSDNGGIHFYTAGSSTATRRMTLKGTSGYLGLGVDNPENLIHTGAGNVGIARTINHAQTSNLTAQYNLSINRESNGASHGHGINKSLNVDNQYTIATFRSTLTNRNGTNQWYDIAKFIAWDFCGKIFVQSGGTFTGDQVEIDVISSYNSALNNGYSGPYLEVKRTEGHHSGRFTKVKIGCHNSNRQPIVQIYHSGNNTHNSNSWVTVTVHDYGSAYGVGSYRGEPRFQAATTLNETWKELDIDGTHMNYWNTSTTPAFSAYKADNANQISSGTYAFNSQILDRGGDNYNTSNGRFTAPCDGVYYFIATLQMYGGSSTNHARFQKNGTDVYNNGTNTPYYDEKHSSHANLQPFCLVELSTDDYVECVRSGNTRGMQSAMIGFLVR